MHRQVAGGTGGPIVVGVCCFFFFFNDTATTEIYTLSLHDALPIYQAPRASPLKASCDPSCAAGIRSEEHTSELQSRVDISYAVFCLKKKTPKTSATARLDPTARTTGRAACRNWRQRTSSQERLCFTSEAATDPHSFPPTVSFRR